MLVFQLSPLSQEHHLLIAALHLAAVLCASAQNRVDTILVVTAFVLINVKYCLNSFTFFHYGVSSLLSDGKIFGVFLLWFVLMRSLYARPE